MDQTTYKKYRAWMWRRIFKRVGIPVLLITLLLTGFILGRRSVTIPECETCPPVVVCPEPIVCETEDDDEYDDDNPDGNPYPTDEQVGDNDDDEDDETPPAPPANQWDQP